MLRFGKSVGDPLLALATQEQKRHNPEIYFYLRDKQQISPRSRNIIKQLNLQLKDNVVISVGCLKDADHTNNEVIFLVRESLHVSLFIMHLYFLHQHCGVGTLVRLYRKYFWTPRVKTIIKSNLRGCVGCRCARGRTLNTPAAPPLPRERVNL